MPEAAHERHALARLVHVQEQHAGESRQRWSRTVVEERDGAVGEAARVVLPGKADARPESEVTASAAEPPFDLPGCTVDFVQGVGVARGDEQVPVRLEID